MPPRRRTGRRSPSRTAAARPRVSSGAGGCSDSRSGRSMPRPAPTFTVAVRGSRSSAARRRRRGRVRRAASVGCAPGLQPGLLLREAVVADDRAPLGPRRPDRLEPAEAVEVVDQLVGVPPEAVEDRPPGRLRLAPVEEAEVEQQPLPLRGRARRPRASPGAPPPRRPPPPRRRPCRRERRPGAVGPDRDQPVAQLLGRDAVDAVVVLDLVEDRLRRLPRASARRRRPSRRRSSPRPRARSR